MVEISKALMLNAKVIIMDEPTSALSGGSQQKVGHGEGVGCKIRPGRCRR